MALLRENVKTKKAHNKLPTVRTGHKECIPIPHLLSIPAEERVMILKALFRGERVRLYLRDPKSTVSEADGREEPAIWSVLLACRQLYIEGRDIHLANTVLYVTSEPHEPLPTTPKPTLWGGFENVTWHLHGTFEWQQPKYLALFSQLRHITIEKGFFFSFKYLYKQYTGPLGDGDRYHPGADNLVNDPYLRTWLLQTQTALQHMREMSGFGKSGRGVLLVTLEFLTANEETVRENELHDPVVFRMTLGNDDQFVLEYTHMGCSYTVEQKPFETK